jgi:hypothetical protein
MQITFGAGFTATVDERDAAIPCLWKLCFSASGPHERKPCSNGISGMNLAIST